MDEPLVLVTRLDDLAEMGLTRDPYKRATVYAATSSVLATFEGSKLNSNQRVMELLRAACFYISAAVGYELATRNTPEQCIAKAKGKLDELRNIINTHYY